MGIVERTVLFIWTCYMEQQVNTILTGHKKKQKES